MVIWSAGASKKAVKGCELIGGKKNTKKRRVLPSREE